MGGVFTHITETGPNKERRGVCTVIQLLTSAGMFMRSTAAMGAWA